MKIVKHKSLNAIFIREAIRHGKHATIKSRTFKEKLDATHEIFMGKIAEIKNRQ